MLVYELGMPRKIADKRPTFIYRAITRSHSYSEHCKTRLRQIQEDVLLGAVVSDYATFYPCGLKSRKTGRVSQLIYFVAFLTVPLIKLRAEPCFPLLKPVTLHDGIQVMRV